MTWGKFVENREGFCIQYLNNKMMRLDFSHEPKIAETRLVLFTLELLFKEAKDNASFPPCRTLR